MLAGFMLRKKESIIKFADKATTWAIYLLLFLLGVSVGTNDTILSSFASLGFIAVVLTLGAVAGSVFASYFVYVHFFKEADK